MDTLNLDQPLEFKDALKALLDGKCLGIRPGNNTGFIEAYKPHWMNQSSPDFMLRWHGSEGTAEIRSNQYLETWTMVILDHRCLRIAAQAPVLVA